MIPQKSKSIFGRYMANYHVAKHSKFIQQMRKKHNLTQEYLASKIGVSRPTYIQIEQGEKDLTISAAKILADIFGIPFEDFLAGKEPEHKIVLEKTRAGKKTDSGLHIRVTQKNLDKFKQVLLYILEKVGGKPNVGETVIHKLLYFIDFDYYEKFEENLMGATYIKTHHGPTSVELGAILKDMQTNGEIEAVKSKYFNHLQKKYLPVVRADLNILSARETSHIDEVLARLSDKNAKEIENYSHEDIPWKAAKEGQPLSYESVFYRDEPYSVRNYNDDL
jgi:transcriptional regulator with XRE-family HTH domain